MSDKAVEKKSKSTSPAENGTDEATEANYVSKVVNNMFQGTQQFFETAKERILGETWWIPSDSKEIAVVPSNAMKKLTAKKECDSFKFCEADYSSGKLYHIVMKWKETKWMSIFRSKEKQEADEYYEHLVQYVTLFPFIGRKKTILISFRLLIFFSFF